MTHEYGLMFSTPVVHTPEVEKIIKKTNEGLMDLIGIMEIPLELLQDQECRDVPWDPCNNWAQLGFCWEWIEFHTPLRFLMEANKRHYTYEDLPDDKRALGFYKLPEMSQTRECKYNIAWSLCLTLKELRKEEAIERGEEE